MKHDAERPTERAIEAAAAEWVGRRDAGLTPEGEVEFQTWLRADPRHPEALHNLEATWSVLAKPLQAGQGAGFEFQLARLGRRRKRRRAALKVVALVVLLSLGGVSWNTLSSRVEGTMSTAVVRVPRQERLPDGSVVELKGDARISADYTPALRRVTLTQGEAHFAVTKDVNRPFIVSARNVDIRAVGTAFSVQLGSSAVEVLVTEGRVAVDKTPETSAPSLQAASALTSTVDAGKRIVVEIDVPSSVPAVSPVSPADLRDRLAWRSTRLEFSRTSLDEAVALLNRHAPTSSARLVVADPALATMRVNGVFRADNTEAFVLLLENAFGVEAERSPHTISLRKAPGPKSE